MYEIYFYRPRDGKEAVRDFCGSWEPERIRPAG